VTTAASLDQKADALRMHERRIANIRQDLRRNLQNSLAVLQRGPLVGQALEEERAKLKGTIDRALLNLEAELGVKPVP